MIIGIDPGLKGGLALMADDGKPVDAITMPRDGRSVDVCALQDAFIRWGAHSGNIRAVVERQQVRARQAGNMTIGANYGRILATLDLCGIEYEEVRPQDWQAAILPDGDTKAAALLHCQVSGYPVPMTSNRKNARPHDGVADAWGIAEFGVDRLGELC